MLSLKAKLSIGAGIIVLAIGMFFLRRKRKNQPRPESPTSVDRQRKLLEIVRSLDATQERPVSEQAINDNFIGQQSEMSFHSILEIYKAQYYLIEDEYPQMVREYRKERRKTKNPFNYARIVQEFQERLENVLEGHLNSVLAEINIDRESWIDMMEEWTSESQEKDQAFKTEVQLCDRMLEEYLYTAVSDEGHETSVAPKTIRQILAFKIQILNSLTDVSTIGVYPQMSSFLISSVLMAHLDDQVFRKFKCQREVIFMSQREALQNSPEDRQLKLLIEDLFDKFTKFIEQNRSECD